MKRLTLKDVAREARVGTATVERVLNGRGGVRAELAERVVRAAKSLGYGVRRIAHRGIIRIEVLLVRPEIDFYANLNSAFRRISLSLDRSIVIHRTFVREDDTSGIARYIVRPTFRRAGLIVVAPDSAAISESIHQARASGVEVVQMLTRSADQTVPYVGIDNYAAGKTAAYYASRMLATQNGHFIVLCHSGAYWAHRERTRGFSDYMLGHANTKHLFPLVVFGHDDQLLTAQGLRDALRHDERVIALYSTAPTQAIAPVLENHCRKVFWIGHSLSEHTASCLRRGLMDMVIDQAPEAQAQRAVQTVLRRLGLLDLDVSTEPMQFLTITAQNLPTPFSKEPG